MMCLLARSTNTKRHLVRLTCPVRQRPRPGPSGPYLKLLDGGLW